MTVESPHTENRGKNLVATSPRNATLVFLVKRYKGKLQSICLAMKKRGFGVNRWNGIGGKVNDTDESIEDAARREAKEEINVVVKDLHKVAELAFYFPHNPAWDQLVHVYFAEQWDGEPTESEEMSPRWFLPSEIPFQEMWPDDIFWLPAVLRGKILKAMFQFGEGDVIQEKEIEGLVDKDDKEEAPHPNPLPVRPHPGGPRGEGNSPPTAPSKDPAVPSSR